MAIVISVNTNYNMPNICDLYSGTIGKYLRENHGDIIGRLDELKKLDKYSSNDPLAHLRTFREEVKRAAKDGKDTILIPSGKTALCIEGLGVKENWVSNGKRINDVSELQVGKEVSQVGEQGGWIITDVLGDGKFKAVLKDTVDSAKRMGMNIGEEAKEIFDISGKVDTKHFVYKLNEESLPREARKMGLNVKGKIEQDNGTWWQIEIPKNRAKLPVEAFGVIPFMGMSSDDK